MSPTIPHDPSDPQPSQPDPGFDNATDPQHAAELDRITDMLADGAITVSEAATRRYAARVALNARLADPGAIQAAAAAYVESLLPPASDQRAQVARALLDRWFAVDQVLGDEGAAMLGFDRARLAALESDPRYLIGRLQQALTGLLERDIPPPDAMDRLMYAAISDAIEYRRDRYLACDCGALCDRCGPDWILSVRYDSLVRELGLMGPDPLTPEGEETAARRRADRAGGAELAARVTAAAAVRGDFERATYDHVMQGGQAPDLASWSQRLSLALASLLDVLAGDR